VQRARQTERDFTSRFSKEVEFRDALRHSEHDGICLIARRARVKHFGVSPNARPNTVVK
jgi:hypothetical protein